MQHRSILAAAALAIGLACAPAHADVRYDFTAISSYPLKNETITGSFSFVVADFVTEDTVLPTSSLLSCDVSATKRGRPRAATCLAQLIRPMEYAGSDAIGFNVATRTNPNRAVLYYFEDGAFGQYGSYDTIEFGADQFATLVVSQVAAVPEPATWLSLAAGLGVLGAIRRKKSPLR